MQKQCVTLWQTHIQKNYLLRKLKNLGSVPFSEHSQGSSVAVGLNFYLNLCGNHIKKNQKHELKTEVNKIIYTLNYRKSHTLCIVKKNYLVLINIPFQLFKNQNFSEKKNHFVCVE